MKKISLFALSFSLGLTCVSLLSNPSSAQSDPNESVYQNNENSSIYGGEGSFNPMQMIHNSRFSGGRSSAEFQEDSSENIDNAAANYRESLMQYWREKQQAQQTGVEESPVEIENAQ